MPASDVVRNANVKAIWFPAPTSTTFDSDNHDSTMATNAENSNPPLDSEKEPVVVGQTSHLSKITKGIDEKLLKHSHDVDAAMQAFEGLDGQVIELTEEKSRALLRKIDWHLMPVG